MSDNVHILQLAKYEAPVIQEAKRENWVEFGEDNDYYNFLINCYTNSTTNNAIINNVARLIYGRGLSATNANKKPNDYASMMAMFNKECVRHLCMDLKMLGQCAMQIIYTKDRKKIAGVHHIPVQLLRAEKCNADGKIEGYYYSDNWEDVKKYPPKRLSAFGCSNDELEVFFVKPYSVGLKYYALPDYVGCTPYCTLEESISEYLINEVNNGFSGRAVINFNNGQPSQEEQMMIKSKVLSQLTGTQGEKVIISFNNNAESKTSVDSMPVNDAPDLYNTLTETCLRKIMLGHQVTSPLLFGIASQNGFSSNADELKDSFILFENMVIKPYREMLTDAFEQILSYNDITLDLFFRTLKPLEFVDLENAQSEEQVQEETGLELSALSKELQDFLDKGEDIEQDGYVCIDERDVHYDFDNNMDQKLKEFEEEITPKPSTLSKVVNLLRTGRAGGNKASEQDQNIDGLFFKVRYQYTGNPAPERMFCRAMMRAQKVYRKEDIIALDSQPANPGFGLRGTQTYSIWLYKGGARCKHAWKRRTYVSTKKIQSIGGPQTNEISEAIAQRYGYVVTDESWADASTQPNKMPNKGFDPNNPNLPKDAK